MGFCARGMLSSTLSRSRPSNTTDALLVYTRRPTPSARHAAITCSVPSTLTSCMSFSLPMALLADGAAAAQWNTTSMPAEMVLDFCVPLANVLLLLGASNKCDALSDVEITPGAQGAMQLRGQPCSSADKCCGAAT